GSFDGAHIVVIEDLGSDGDGDIIATARVGDTIAWYENDGLQNFTRYIIADNYDWPTFVNPADLDGDGDIDIACAAYNDDDVSWLENNGSMSFTMNHIDTEYDGAIPVVTGDINGDGREDIVSCAYNLNSVTWWENTDSTSAAGGETAGSLSSFVIAPNPSNGSFSIEYSINENCVVTADIYDVSGRLARSFIENANRGVHSITVSKLSVGVYMVRLAEGDLVSCRRVSVIR
ncbi:MAG: T9SS type A sorting domain-containing protein, partial [Candidatus Aegiribacteria sp.]|nr:T9SS type A sorting domain-containing protein [Candidatus Aegiribacteria sp.]